jgi:hypothetical protein
MLLCTFPFVANNNGKHYSIIGTLNEVFTVSIEC